MADRVSVTIKIGGPLPSALLDEFCAIAEAYALSSLDGALFDPSMITGAEPLELGAHEVAWGRLDDLEAFCMASGLRFARWCDVCPGAWEAERLVFDGTGEPRSYMVTSNDVVVITAPEARSLGSLAAIDAYFASADADIPPLQIVEEQHRHG